MRSLGEMKTWTARWRTPVFAWMIRARWAATLLGVSPYGVMIMAGNVFEWVNDWYNYMYYSVPDSTNPIGPSYGTSRVYRGASYYSSEYASRTANRFYFRIEDYYPDPISPDLGIRSS